MRMNLWNTCAFDATAPGGRNVGKMTVLKNMPSNNKIPSVLWLDLKLDGKSVVDMTVCWMSPQLLTTGSPCQAARGKEKKE
jgi:hypothetical protein